MTVCHLPPGTSKWNATEHRFFAYISMNGRGHPLTSHEVLVSLINATITRQGRTVYAERDTNSYPGGIKTWDEEMRGDQPPPTHLPGGMELHPSPVAGNLDTPSG